MKTELEKALAGLEYDARDQEVREMQAQVKKWCHEFNHATPNDPIKSSLLAKLVSGYNDQVFIEEGFHCLFGKNIHFEGMAMLNYNCTILDSQKVYIGDRALIGPGCQLICTNHALDADERLAGLFDNKPIRLGRRAWLGANVTVLPGVTIGDGAVIGAGSVVTKDVPANHVAVGNPCRVIRPITAEDKLMRDVLLQRGA
ncbi:TPA: sugar O-acetyltransferase [Streptococcus suis]|nr:sugar O-acetyltransferase [Streptococcus suis]